MASAFTVLGFSYTTDKPYMVKTSNKDGGVSVADVCLYCFIL